MAKSLVEKLVDEQRHVQERVVAGEENEQIFPLVERDSGAATSGRKRRQVVHQADGGGSVVVGRVEDGELEHVAVHLRLECHVLLESLQALVVLEPRASSVEHDCVAVAQARAIGEARVGVRSPVRGVHNELVRLTGRRAPRLPDRLLAIRFTFSLTLS